MRNEIRIRASKDFVETLDKLYPYKRSIREKTEELNKLLEDWLYDKKQKRKFR